MALLLPILGLAGLAHVANKTTEQNYAASLAARARRSEASERQPRPPPGHIRDRVLYDDHYVRGHYTNVIGRQRAQAGLHVRFVEHPVSRKIFTCEGLHDMGQGEGVA